MSRFNDENIECKIYVGDLSFNTSKQDLEEAFAYYGPIRNVWVARNPPGFAFVEFEDSRDAEDAVKEVDGRRHVAGRKVRVERADGRRAAGGGRRGGYDRGYSGSYRGSRGPPSYGSRRGIGSGRPYQADDRCFTCGDRGHYARDCRQYGGRGGRSRRYSRSRSHSRNRSYSRSVSRGRRSRSREGRRRSRSRDDKRSGSRSPDAKRRSRTPDAKRRSRSPDAKRRSRSPDMKRRSRSPDARRRSRSRDDKRAANKRSARKSRSRSYSRRSRSSSRSKSGGQRSRSRSHSPANNKDVSMKSLNGNEDHAD